jgi:hypothetical protein
MSNTSTVTPYESEGSVEVGAGSVCVAGALAVVAWLCEETPEERAVRDGLELQRGRELAGAPTAGLAAGASTRRVSTTALHVRDCESFVRTATALGYRQERLAATPAATGSPSPVLLRNQRGERIAVARNARGRVVVQTAGGPSRVKRIVRQHVVDRALEHLRSSGTGVEHRVLADGSVQIVANASGGSECRVQVQQDGRAWIDIDRVRGPGCSTMVQDLTHAMGAEVEATRRKDAFFQLPGEPTKTEVKVGR